MPLPAPKLLHPHEAVTRVKHECLVSSEEAVSALDRAVREHVLELVNDKGEKLRLNNSRIDWNTGVVEFRVPILLSSANVGRKEYYRAYFITEQIDRWLRTAATYTPIIEHEPLGVSKSEKAKAESISASTADRKGFRTTTEKRAEDAAGKWIKSLKPRPKNQEDAFERCRQEVASFGHLSRRAFDRAWHNNAPEEWQLPGRRKRVSEP
jgi:hypothetical protein